MDAQKAEGQAGSQERGPSYRVFAAIIAIGLMAVTVLVIIGGAMIMNALVIAFLGGLGFWVLFMKLPKNFRNFIARCDLWADLAITGSVFWAYGLTATGIMSAAITDLFLGIALFANKIRYERDMMETKGKTR